VHIEGKLDHQHVPVMHIVKAYGAFKYRLSALPERNSNSLSKETSRLGRRRISGRLERASRGRQGRRLQLQRLQSRLYHSVKAYNRLLSAESPLDHAPLVFLRREIRASQSQSHAPPLPRPFPLAPALHHFLMWSEEGQIESKHRADLLHLSKGAELSRDRRNLSCYEIRRSEDIFICLSLFPESDIFHSLSAGDADLLSASRASSTAAKLYIYPNGERERESPSSSFPDLLLS